MGSGEKIIIGMDQLVASSLTTSTFSAPIIRGKIAIKPSTSVDPLEDISFPDISYKEYESYDSWVLDSGDNVFLSGNALETGDIRYAVILFRDVSSRLPRDTGRQNLPRSLKVKDLEHKQIRSSVISFSLSREIRPLSPALHMTFKISQDNFKNPTCAFLDTTVQDGSIWSTEGCRTIDSGSDTVQCLCNHLTNFAILMSPTGTLDEEHAVLSAITYVGCAISILFLLITVAVHLFVWKYIKCDRVKLHLHLSVCLLLSFITFLAGIKRTENGTGCTVVAAILHYLFLSSFFLMLVEGIHIFLSVTIVFHHKSVLLKLLLLAYGVPLLIVGVSLGISEPADYRRNDFCWLKRQSGAVWAFIGPAAVIILVNYVIFGLVVKAVLRDQAPHTMETRSETKSMMRAICVLSPILGLTWIFGLLAVNDNVVAFQYLFAAFNSLQGFFMFLFHCAFSSQVRNAIQASRRRQRVKSLDLTPKSSSNIQACQKNQMNGTVSFCVNMRPKPLFDRFKPKTKYTTDKDSKDRARKQSSSSVLSVIGDDFLDTKQVSETSSHKRPSTSTLQPPCV